MVKFSQVLSYYLDCYREDSGDLNLWNLNKLSKNDRLMLTGQDELGTGFLPRLPIAKTFAEQMIKRVDMYQRERVLLYTSFFLQGKVEIKGEMKSISAPLLFNEATIEQEGDNYYFSVNHSSPELNESLVELLLPEQDITTLIKDKRDLTTPSFWTSLFDKSPLELNTLALLDFPRLMSEDDMKKASRRKVPSLLPISQLVLVERSTSTRGILHELETIIDTDSLSPPLTDLFSSNTTSSQNKPLKQSLKYDYLPGLLSNAQKEVISIAAHSNLGCVSGPPGTGKSYTIAAIAAEHMARGESVLIVANNESALSVIGDKLDQNFGLGDISIRASQKEFIKKLKQYIDDLLAGYFTQESSDELVQSELDSLTEINQKLSLLENRFIKYCRKAIVRGQRVRKLEDKNIAWLTDLYLGWAKYGINELVTQWECLDDINVKHLAREEMASRYLNRLKAHAIKTLIEQHRPSLKAFNQAIRSRTSQRQFELFDNIDYSILLTAFPVWLVSLNMLHRVLPLKTNMFDLVIIDEATQCNISSTLPALYRAKRAIVVGDTKQLKHYSFLSKAKESQLMNKHGVSLANNGVVSYRDNSILDLALSQLTHHDQVAFLDEHFRSKPQLINFSNISFYQNKLKVMQHRPCTSSGHLHIERIDGVRNKQGVNEVEANEVINHIMLQLKQDEHTDIKHSIGVISPFRDQAEYISRLIESTFTTQQIKTHKLRAATPYGFQGEERDIMLISFALDNDSRRAAVYLNKADVFNVTITRAREKQVLFLSLDENLLPENNLLKNYIHSIAAFEAAHSITSQIDAFQQQVIEQLSKLNIKTWAGYTLAGLEVDLLCEHEGTYLALDLIGFPGPWTDFFELNTYKIFQRAGVKVLPISYGLWVIDKQVCLDKILTVLKVNHLVKQ